MPGVMSSRRLAQPVILVDSWTTNGRGPTRLISPRRTFHSCGSSSRLQRRSALPTRVIRGSSLILKSAPPTSFSSARPRRSFSAPTRIVRNLTMRKIDPPRPWRSWRKKTGPRLSSFTASATTAITGASNSSPRAARVTSTARLVKRTPRDRRIGGRFTTGMPSSSWIVALEAKTSKKRGTIDR